MDAGGLYGLAGDRPAPRTRSGARRGLVNRLLEVAHGVHGAPVDAHLEVQVRTRGVARVARLGDDLPLRDVLPDADADRRQVGVTGRHRPAVLDADVVAVAAHRPGDRDAAAVGGADRRADRDPEIHALMVRAPDAAGTRASAEAGRDRT